MASGEGKGWAKGRTAATDPRVARVAAAHSGKLYTRRKPLSEMKWLRATHTKLPIEWSAEMAYVVGLTATDGCLASGSRGITFKSMDRQLVETYRRLLGRSNKIGTERTKTGSICYRLQFKDTRLYRWFQSVGVTPRKSLTLGAIEVPDEFFAPLVRGLLDGDGSISNGVWKADTTRRSDYYYEWLRTRFVSAARRILNGSRPSFTGSWTSADGFGTTRSREMALAVCRTASTTASSCCAGSTPMLPTHVSYASVPFGTTMSLATPIGFANCPLPFMPSPGGGTVDASALGADGA